MTALELLEKIKTSYHSLLGSKLAGIYVHGSIAFGCFCWDISDIDFLVVINQRLTQEEKEALISVLLDLDPFATPKGFEMSVVLETVCSPFLYPTPFELHFSNAHKARCQTNLAEYCRTMNGTDKDLAAHFTVIRHVGQVLWGKPIPEVFGEVPKADYLGSIVTDVQDALVDIHKQPVYYILNLCRVLAFLQNDLVLSKAQGGTWGINNLPEYRTLIGSALAAYENHNPFRAEEIQLQAFANAMLTEIHKYGEKSC